MRRSGMISIGWCDVVFWDDCFEYLWGLWRKFRAAWAACWMMYEKFPRCPGAKYVHHTVYVPVFGKNIGKVYRFRVSMN